MKRALWLSTLVLVLATGCVTQLAQTPPTGMPIEVVPPEIASGSIWRYGVHDGFTKLPRGTIEYRTNTVQAGTVTIGVRTETQEWTELYTRDGSWLERPATNMQTFTYSPAYQAFAFPLRPGKIWQARSIATDAADGRRFPVRIKGTVLGWERVNVPAGEFDALKVRRNVFLDYWQQGVRGQSIIVEHEWYAPTVKHAVKRETSSQYLSYLYARSTGFTRTGGEHDGGGPRYIQDDWLVYELLSHSAQ